MNKWLYYLTPAACLVLIVMGLSGCGQDQTSRDDVAPSAPVWIPRTPDNGLAQQGIRAEPVQNDGAHRNDNSHWVRLEWYANPESDVTTYRVWRISETDPDPRDHYVVKDLRLGVDLDEGLSRYYWVDKGDNPNDQTTNNLAPDQTTGQSRGFYWELQAVDSAGNRSPLAPRNYYRLLANPSQLAVTRDSAYTYHVTYLFTANSSDDVPLYDMVRVYPQQYGPDSVVWATTPPVQRYVEQGYVQIDLHSVSLHMTPGATYICQVNALCNRQNEAHTDSLAGSAAFTTFIFQP